MESNIKKNYIYQVLYQVLVSVLPFITSPYIARVLGADSLGTYTYTLSIVTYFKLFAALGIVNYGNRVIAKAKDNQELLNRTFSSLFFVHVILTVVIIFIYLFYWKEFVVDNKLIALIQGMYLIGELLDINWFFFGMEQFKLTVIRNAIIKVLTVVAVFALVKDKSDLWVYVLIMALGSFFSISVLWLFVRKYVRFVAFTKEDCLKHMKPLVILFFAILAVSVFSYMDKIMIGKMSNMSQLGYYENAWKMIEFPTGFVTSLGTVMLPKISNLVTSGKKEQVHKYLSESMKFSMIASLAIAFGVASIANEFSVVFWGPDFSTSGTLMIVMSIAIMIMSWNIVIRNQYLIPYEFDRIYLFAVSTGAIVNFVANYLLIPRYQAVGAAIGTVCAYFSVCLVQTIFAARELPIRKYIINFIPYLIPAIIMFFSVRIIGNILGYRVLTLFVEILVGVLVFILVTLFMAKSIGDQFVLKAFIKIKQKVCMKQ